LSALCCTAALSSSIEAAVCCNALACSSVRDERSRLPAAICVLAMATLSAFSRTSVTMLRERVAHALHRGHDARPRRPARN
jgi:hypothetical protein